MTRFALKNQSKVNNAFDSQVSTRSVVLILDFSCENEVWYLFWIAFSEQVIEMNITSFIFFLT